MPLSSSTLSPAKHNAAPKTRAKSHTCGCFAHILSLFYTRPAPSPMVRDGCGASDPSSETVHDRS